MGRVVGFVLESSSFEGTEGKGSRYSLASEVRRSFHQPSVGTCTASKRTVTGRAERIDCSSLGIVHFGDFGNLNFLAPLS